MDRSLRSSSPRYMQTRSKKRKNHKGSSQISDWYRLKKANPLDSTGNLSRRTRGSRFTKTSNIASAQYRTRKNRCTSKNPFIMEDSNMEQNSEPECRCTFLNMLTTALKRTTPALETINITRQAGTRSTTRIEPDELFKAPYTIKCDSEELSFTDKSLERSILQPIVDTLSLLHDKTHILLSPTPATPSSDTAATSGTKGFAQWFLEDPRLASWRSGGQQNILWLAGPTGSGKTALSSAISHNLDHNRSPFDIIAHHLYDGPGELSSKSAVLLSLMKQIVLPIGQSYEIPLLALLERPNSTLTEQYDFSEIFKLVIDLVISIPHVRLFMILDGFNETIEDDNAIRTISEILRIVANTPQIRCLVTSDTSTSSLALHLTELGAVTVDLGQEQIVQTQLTNFARSCIDEALPADESNEEQKQTFIQVLAQKARSFLWVRLAAENLLNTLSSSQNEDIDLEAQIHNLPSDIEPLLCSRLERIRPTSLRIARKVFSWIICAARPLNILEVLGALQLEKNFHTAPNIFNDDPWDHTRGLNVVCGGLVTVGEDSKLQFIHSSVKPFLLSTALAGSSLVKYSISWNQANENVARDCLDYLSRPDTLKTQKSEAQRCAMEYVYNFWITHYRRSESYSQSLAGCLHRLVEGHGARLLEWSAFYAKTAAEGVLISMETPLLFCATFGLEGLARMLLAAGKDPNLMAGGKTSLHLAANNGHVNIVRLLLDRGVDITRLTESHPFGKDAIQLAQANGKLEIVSVICSNGLGDQLA